MRRAAGVLLASLGFAPAAIAQLAFDGPRTTRIGPSTAGLATADFDEDGRADLVLALTDDDAATVLLSGPDGGFRAMSIPTGAGPADVAAADFDGDGHADIVTADRTAGTVTLHAGDGSGAFAPGRPFATGAEPSGVDVADIDADGAFDLLVTRPYSLDVLRNDGLGGFFAPQSVGTGARGRIIGVDAADFDEDGALDAALLWIVEGPIPDVFWCEAAPYFGDGSGGFAAGSPVLTFLPAARSSGLVARDADGDGRVDLVVPGHVLGTIVLRGGGDGSFDSPAIAYSTGGAAVGVAVEDADADGRVDLYCANLNRDRGLAVLSGDDRGGFRDTAFGPTSRPARRLAAADVDGDGHGDAALVVADGGFSSDYSLDVFLNRSPSICRAGTVNAGAGAIADVLFVNDSAGGAGRRRRLASHEPLVVFLAAPPAARGPVEYAMYGWAGEPGADAARVLPFGIGTLCRGGAPRVIWNTTGRRSLGVPTIESDLAPAVLASLRSGLGRPGVFFLQGVILDAASAAARPASVTNGVIVDLR